MRSYFHLTLNYQQLFQKLILLNCPFLNCLLAATWFTSEVREAGRICLMGKENCTTSYDVGVLMSYPLLMLLRPGMTTTFRIALRCWLIKYTTDTLDANAACQLKEIKQPSLLISSDCGFVNWCRWARAEQARSRPSWLTIKHAFKLHAGPVTHPSRCTCQRIPSWNVSCLAMYIIEARFSCSIRLPASGGK